MLNAQLCGKPAIVPLFLGECAVLNAQSACAAARTCAAIPFLHHGFAGRLLSAGHFRFLSPKNGKIQISGLKAASFPTI